jgi:hypothetical protein
MTNTGKHPEEIMIEINPGKSFEKLLQFCKKNNLLFSK